MVHGLIPELVFGPVDSRRLGRSLGVNPFPPGEKICSFNCPYCECGWTSRLWVGAHMDFAWPEVDRLVEEITARLEQFRATGEKLDAITFAGNGEPTLHPGFPLLIDKTIAARNVFTPHARIVVLTNASELHREEIRQALMRVDEACIKLDAASSSMVHRINRPHASLSIDSIIDQIASFPSPHIQTMFVQGPSDNTGEAEVTLWIEALKRIQPARVDIYSLDRHSPDTRLSKVPREILDAIAGRVRNEVGVPVFVY